MPKKFIEYYKIPLLLSFTLAVVLVALKIERSPLQIALLILGSIAGTFLLDLDYIAQVYFLEPNSDFSKTIATFIKHKDFSSAASYISYHKDEIKDKILNSVIFQIGLGALMVFVITSSANYFVKALVLSAFVNSMYRMAELHLQNRDDEWFWALKNKPDKRTFTFYSVALFAVLVYCLSVF